MKTCDRCVYCWANGDGYSDYTWMTTEYRCFLGINSSFPVGRFADRVAAALATANDCDQFYESDKPIPTVSPDGELEDGDRLAQLLRGLSK